MKSTFSCWLALHQVLSGELFSPIWFCYISESNSNTSGGEWADTREYRKTESGCNSPESV